MQLKKVHEDKRGETFSLTGELLGHPEVAIFYTKAGISRGGCIHNNSDEYLCVISGEIEYVYGEMHKVTLGPGDSWYTPKNTPHYFRSISNSVVMEWGPEMSEKQEHHEYFRSIVNALNAQ